MMTTGFWRKMAWSLVLVTVAGCNCEKGCAGEPSTNQERPSGGAQAPTRVRTTNGPADLGLKALTIEPAWLECHDDKDCAHVPGDCCGCAAGGTDVAINWKNLEAAGTSRAAQCADVSCTMVMSNDLSCRKDARCVAGKCALVLSNQAAPQGVGVEPIKPKMERNAPVMLPRPQVREAVPRDQPQQDAPAPK